jgi:hypothetical protein
LQVLAITCKLQLLASTCNTHKAAPLIEDWLTTHETKTARLLVLYRLRTDVLLGTRRKTIWCDRQAEIPRLRKKEPI